MHFDIENGLKLNIFILGPILFHLYNIFKVSICFKNLKSQLIFKALIA